MIYNSSTINIDIKDSVLCVFKKHIQIHNKANEAGGILIGEVFDNLIVITDCSVPNQFDKSSRNNFIRAYKPAQKFIDKHFFKSNGTKIYLGEWHTHPEDIPSPSNLDITSFTKTIELNKLNSNIHFMIIVGIKSIYISIYKDKDFVEKFIIKKF